MLLGHTGSKSEERSRISTHPEIWYNGYWNEVVYQTLHPEIWQNSYWNEVVDQLTRRYGITVIGTKSYINSLGDMAKRLLVGRNKHYLTLYIYIWKTNAKKSFPTI